MSARSQKDLFPCWGDLDQLGMETKQRGPLDLSFHNLPKSQAGQHACMQVYRVPNRAREGIRTISGTMHEGKRAGAGLISRTI